MVQVNKTASRVLGALFGVCSLAGCDSMSYNCDPEGRSVSTYKQNFDVSFTFKQAGEGILGQDKFHRHKETYFMNHVAQVGKVKKDWVCESELPSGASSTRYPSTWWSL